MSDWSVPVSRHVRFLPTAGRASDPDYDASQAAVLEGRLEKIVCDVRWPLVNLASGDTVWL